MLGDVIGFGKGLVERVRNSDTFAIFATPLLILLSVLLVLVGFPLYLIVGFAYLSLFVGSGVYFLYSLTFGWFNVPLLENLGALAVSFVVFAVCFYLSVMRNW